MNTQQRTPEWYADKVGKTSGSRFTPLMETIGGRDAIPAKPAQATVRDDDGNVITRARKATPAKPAIPGKPTKKRENLIADLITEHLTGELTQIFQTFAMKRGLDLEPFGIEAYENHQMVAVEEVGFIVHEKLDFVGVSPDGLIGSEGMIELKCPFSSAKHLDALISDSHADEYKWQVQGQLWVCSDRKWCDVVSYDPRFPEHLQLAICRVYPDPEMHKQLEDACIVANDEVQARLAELDAKYPDLDAAA